MNWTNIVILAAIAVVFLLLKRIGLISSRAAREHLEKGAIVIDVRTEEEFATGHLRRAINMPMDQIESMAPRRLKDRNQVLLLHCHSGMRSATAVKKLKRMGYASAFNLGSFGRAGRIAGA
jgi:phage shock protein E